MSTCSHLPEPISFSARYRGPALQAGGAEPSDQAGGGGEGAAAARHPGAVGEAEPGQREPGAATGGPGHVRPHHRRDRGRLHQGVCLSLLLLFKQTHYSTYLCFCIWS